MKQEKIINIQTKLELDWNKVDSLKDNSLLKINPETWIEWDFNKNNDLNFDIYKFHTGSTKKVNWICLKCKSPFIREVRKHLVRKNCPYCIGTKVNHTNCLVTVNPELATQWHPTLNGVLTPYDVTSKEGKAVWWLGKCGHEWEAIIRNRVKLEENCPYCRTKNPKVLKGFNDMWTINPELAKKLLNPEEGYILGEYSNKITNWKCSCGEVINNKRIHMINARGLDCPNCSDIHFPEKVMYCLLRKIGIQSNKEATFSWSRGKRYDFYIPSLNMIIETHGGQHYFDTGFGSMGGRSLEEEQENDLLKEKLAKEHLIDKYIVIDCRKSELEWIKNSILNSELNEIFNLENLNFEELEQDINNSLVVTVWNLWDSGLNSVSEISKSLNLDEHTVRQFLKRRKVNK